LLTDNGRAMNQQRLGRVTTLVAYAATLGTRAITSSPYHPQTMGKNERVHQTLKRWLNAQTPAASIAELTAQVMVFDEHYNHRRPLQALEMATPAHVLTTRQRALPPEPPAPALPPTKRRRGRPAQPLRTVKVLRNGSAPVGRYFIGLGVEYAGTRVIAMIDDTTIAVFDSRGTHLRTVTVNPDQRFYGTGRPRGGKRRHPAQ
jgi:hypothetical protein